MFTLTTYFPYEDNVLDVLAKHQIKQALFNVLHVTTLPTVLTGTTTGSESGTVLIDSGATFQTDSVVAGDVVYNSTDGSVAIVKSVDSETQLTCTALVSGSDNLWQTSDGYAVRGVPNQVILLTADDGVNAKGFYKRNSGNSAWEETHQGGGAAPIAINNVDFDTQDPAINRLLHTPTSNLNAVGHPNGSNSSWYFQFQIPDGWSATNDIIFDLGYEASVGSGNFRLKLEYWVIADGGDTTPATSPTATKQETIAAPAAVETYKKITTSTLIIANADLTAVGDVVVMKFTREGGDAADTNTGELYLENAVAYQA